MTENIESRESFVNRLFEGLELGELAENSTAFSSALRHIEAGDLDLGLAELDLLVFFLLISPNAESRKVLLPQILNVKMCLWLHICACVRLLAQIGDGGTPTALEAVTSA